MHPGRSWASQGGSRPGDSQPRRPCPGRSQLQNQTTRLNPVFLQPTSNAGGRWGVGGVAPFTWGTHFRFLQASLTAEAAASVPAWPPPLAAMQSQCPKLSATTRGTRTRGVERVCPLLSHSGTPSGVSISHPSSPHAAAVHHRAWLVRAVTNTPARRAAAQCSPDSNAASPTTASGGRRCSYCAVLVRSGIQTQAPASQPTLPPGAALPGPAPPRQHSRDSVRSSQGHLGNLASAPR